MINRIICWIFGHKFPRKSYILWEGIEGGFYSEGKITGGYEITEALAQIKISTSPNCFIWQEVMRFFNGNEQKDKCYRCGKIK